MSRGGLAYRAGVGIAAAALIGLLIGAVVGDTEPYVWIILGVVLAVAAGVTGFALLRPVQVALRDVGAASSRIAGGELGERVAVASGAAGELTGNFNLMSRRLEELFQEANAEHARLDAVLNASTDGVLALAADTTVRLANDAAHRMLGADEEQMLNRPLIESARDYELDALARRVAETRQPANEVITYGPARLPLRAAALPIESGGEWAVLLLLTDLTDVIRIDQVRRDFVSNVSHELRTPLASIRALAETIEAGDVDPGDETTEFAARIRGQVDRLTTLVNELLELSKIESGAVELRPRELDLAQVAAEAASLLEPRSSAGGVTIQLRGAAPTIEADPGAVLKMFSNLLDNAIKFSPPGGTVVVEATEAEDSVSISVRDEGPGIAAADLQRVFERFFKGDSSRSGLGVGLGLAIVKHLVRSHGGVVEAQSEQGHGAKFVVTLPKKFAGPRVPLER